MDEEIIAEKVAQARDAVADSDADVWLTFARETEAVGEPCLPYLLGFDVVWPTLVLVTPDRSVTIIGRYDAPTAEELAVHEVVPYDESMAAAFGEFLDAEDPGTVAVNYSRDDDVADGLTHGMYLRLGDLLAEAGHDPDLVGAEPIVSRVRGIKSATEHERIAGAAERTEALLAEATDAWEPGWTEADFSEYVHDRMREEGYGSAWAWEYCPTVHNGAAAEVGHTLPGDRTLPPGEILHLDFGVVHDGYAADLQRLYYRPREEGGVPEDLKRTFEDVRAAVEVGRRAIEPGVVGHEVDGAAREAFTDRGREEWKYALGHQVGRRAHDGGTLLGPPWDRYGDRPRGEVRAGEVYTLELGTDTEYGYVGLEEIVRVTDEGAEYVVEPQTELRWLEE